MRRMSQPIVQNGAAQDRPPALRYQPLVIVVLAASAGIVADRQWSIPLGACFATAFLAWAVWLGL